VSTANAANGEALLFALRGSMRVNGVSMGSFDVAYLPRGMSVSVELEPNTIAYLAESGLRVGVSFTLSGGRLLNQWCLVCHRMRGGFTQ
jgi:hypothetical protein